MLFGDNFTVALPMKEPEIVSDYDRWVFFLLVSTICDGAYQYQTPCVDASSL